MGRRLDIRVVVVCLVLCLALVPPAASHLRKSNPEHTYFKNPNSANVASSLKTKFYEDASSSETLEGKGNERDDSSSTWTNSDSPSGDWGDRSESREDAYTFEAPTSDDSLVVVSQEDKESNDNSDSSREVWAGAPAPLGDSFEEDNSQVNEDSSSWYSSNSASGEEESSGDRFFNPKPMVDVYPFVGSDLVTEAPCTSSIRKYCADVTPGDGKLVECVWAKIKEQALGNTDEVILIPDICKRAVRDLKISMYRNISLDVKLVKACRMDIKKLCSDEYLYPEVGSVLGCLREAGTNKQLSTRCQKEVFRAKEEASFDIAFDPQINEVCNSDIQKHCYDVEPGEGRIQECLRSKMIRISWDCISELFRQEVENADDIRLNFKLFRSCLVDIKRFCRDVPHGDGRITDCLELNRLEPDFSPSCKDEFDIMMARRASDFRLDYHLRTYCRGDIARLCYPDVEELSDSSIYEAKVIECLQDYRDELKDPRCKVQVHKLTVRAAEDIRFDKTLLEACKEDRQTLCRDVPDGNGQVFQCLQEKREKLRDTCRLALFNQEVRFGADIDFKFPMKTACRAEINRFCRNNPSGNGLVIKCLQENMDDSEMGEGCIKEIKKNALRTAEDYHLNYRLNKGCFSDVQKLCGYACDSNVNNGSITCEGTVLKCLTEKIDQIASKSCKKEVIDFKTLEIKDVSLDIPLQRACEAELKVYCPYEVDHSRTLTCLRKNRDHLSPGCKEEEKRFSLMEVSDARLTPSLMNACGKELELMCKEMDASSGKTFECLQSKLENPNMKSACLSEINLQEARHLQDDKLGVNLGKECESDAAKYCGGVNQGKPDHTLALRCFVSNFEELARTCQTEVSHAIRTALWQYRMGSELTHSCDENVRVLCSSDAKNLVDGAVIGVYGQCLVSQNHSALDSECKALVRVASKEGAHVGGKVDNEHLADTLKKLHRLAADSPRNSSEELILALWAVCFALVLVLTALLIAGYVIYFKYFGICEKEYSLVEKEATDIPEQPANCAV